MKLCSNGNVEILKLLLEQKGIDINAKNVVSLIYIIFQLDIWCLLLLFMTALMLAVKNFHIEIVKLLLEQEEIDFNAKDVCEFYSKFNPTI